MKITRPRQRPSWSAVAERSGDTALDEPEHQALLHDDEASKAVWRYRFPPHSKGRPHRPLHWLTAVIILMTSPAHAETLSDKYTFERGLMGTRFAITCYSPDQDKAKSASDSAFEAAEKINEVASDYIADSELLNLSKPFPTDTATSPLLFKLIFEARDFAEKTNGYFDPTLGPLTKLWRESRRRKALPDAETLAKARAAIGWQNLVLDPHTHIVAFQKPGMRLDLGGIAKGQAADAMLAVMTSHGISCCCITAGGDVRLGDPPPDSQGWKVKIHVKENEAERFLTLSNCAVSTSGELHQFIEINGTRYSHIIDPATGLGITRSVAATVIAPTATISDALATACCVAPADLAEKMALAAGATDVLLAE